MHNILHKYPINASVLKFWFSDTDNTRQPLLLRSCRSWLRSASTLPPDQFLACTIAASPCQSYKCYSKKIVSAQLYWIIWTVMIPVVGWPAWILVDTKRCPIFSDHQSWCFLRRLQWAWIMPASWSSCQRQFDQQCQSRNVHTKSEQFIGLTPTTKPLLHTFFLTRGG